MLSWPTVLICLLIRLYQTIRKPFPAVCRFYPSCSTYAHQSFSRYGLFQGGWLAIKRLCRCHPWHPGGLDLLPSCNKT